MIFYMLCFDFNENQLRFQPTFPQEFQLNLLGLLNACMIWMLFEVQNFCDGSYYTLVMHKKRYCNIVGICVCIFSWGKIVFIVLLQL